MHSRSTRARSIEITVKTYNDLYGGKRECRRPLKMNEEIAAILKRGENLTKFF
jgi:hypothetical protein